MTLGGAASTHGETRLPGEPGSNSADIAGHDPLSTRLTREYGVRYPLVSAGKGFVSYPPLETAVSNAGGSGVLCNAIETMVVYAACQFSTPSGTLAASMSGMAMYSA